MTDLDNSALRQKLESLSKGKQLVFALLLSERMIPALDKFSSDTNFDSSIYHGGLDSAWAYLAGEVDISSYVEMAEESLAHAPDTEEFDHPLTSAALNAALSLAAVMSFLADHDVAHVVEAAGLARDTAALYAQSVAATPPHSLGFKETMRHPIVQQELQRQAEDLKFLESLPTDIPREIIPLIKERTRLASGLPSPEN
jgi:uncharacterized protein YjaG (DUF416 family)